MGSHVHVGKATLQVLVAPVVEFVISVNMLTFSCISESMVHSIVTDFIFVKQKKRKNIG